MGYLYQQKCILDHISYISHKLSKGIAILYCVSSINNMDALRNLYCTLILPYLSYCAMVWGNVVVVVVVVVNFIKHQNRAITGERVAARAAPSYQYAMVLVINIIIIIYNYK